MKIPRDISGREVIKALRKFEYRPSRQVGSHVRCTTEKNGQHHVTVPDHDRVSIGALNSVLREVAGHFQKTKEEIAKELFG